MSDKKKEHYLDMLAMVECPICKIKYLASDGHTCSKAK